MVGNKAPSLPDKCLLQLKDFTIYMMKARGITFLVMTEFHYPVALAFSFLTELMKEFIQQYEPAKLISAKRPYHFIEFDSTIHKLRQAYNKPQSLANRVNLSDLNAELTIRPPYRLAVTDVEPIINGAGRMNVPQMGVGPPPRLEPISIWAWIAVLLSSCLIALGFYRGLVSLHLSSIEMIDGPNPIHGLLYIVEALVRTFQLYLLFYNTRHRDFESWLAVFAHFLCIYFLWDLRDYNQHFVFTISTIATHLCTIYRRLQEKLPDYHI
ncbi:SEC22 vesicle trafficking protein homolog A (S. cerevisiae) [Nesidiocoris tenuis]|uniref:SEC22 vesicle trafficking protein homolog A (S. cerevisiae) n=1 Tax=Nesidiocoris tenuis TaxID=355587 RepID=A0ABN7A5W8_9HEMI|nr:SEC22 vesicle trafficking protein homolog A (S. cerevisiae) [Nesidiocoris tenuis]